VTKNKPTNDLGDVVMYRTEDGKTALEVRLVDETVWLSQAQIAELFAVNVPAISKHVKNIYNDKELTRKATVSKMETVQTEGKRQVSRSLVAASDPKDKDVFIRLVMNMLAAGQGS
jgi:hypothetical protein